jgi:hypothetical protein
VVVHDQHTKRIGLPLLCWLEHFAQLSTPFLGAGQSSEA